MLNREQLEDLVHLNVIMSKALLLDARTSPKEEIERIQDALDSACKEFLAKYDNI
jgi:hypothetical protein